MNWFVWGVIILPFLGGVFFPFYTFTKKIVWGIVIVSIFFLVLMPVNSYLTFSEPSISLPITVFPHTKNFAALTGFLGGLGILSIVFMFYSIGFVIRLGIDIARRKKKST